MAGLRDIVIHEYFGVDIENVWKIVKVNLPEVKPELKNILEEIG